LCIIAGIEQDGGHRDGALYIVRGGDVVASGNDLENYLLRPGSTYLLAARYSAENSYLVLQFPQSVSWKELAQDKNLTNPQLKLLAENDSRFKQLLIAYPNETLLDADIYHNNTLNSYQSLTEAQKYALPYYTGSYNPNPPPPAPPTSTATSTQ